MSRLSIILPATQKARSQSSRTPSLCRVSALAPALKPQPLPHCSFFYASSCSPEPPHHSPSQQTSRHSSTPSSPDPACPGPPTSAWSSRTSRAGPVWSKAGPANPSADATQVFLLSRPLHCRKCRSGIPCSPSRSLGIPMLCQRAFLLGVLHGAVS